MSKTQRYREQHEELLSMASKISEKLNFDDLSENASEAHRMLSELMGKIKYHLAIEDKSVYPLLLEHTDDVIKSTTQRFIDEMGNIKEVIEDYFTKWSNAQVIHKDAASFIEETKGIFDALAKRIEKENNELYKMVDELV